MRKRLKMCAAGGLALLVVSVTAYFIVPEVLYITSLDHSAPADQLKLFKVRGLLDNPHNRYYAEKLSCGSGQATVVYGEVPRARYWALHTYDRWSRSIDGLVDSNITTAGGRFEVRIAPTRGGAENWIPCSALGEGFAVFRTTLLEGNLTPPRFRVEPPP